MKAIKIALAGVGLGAVLTGLVACGSAGHPAASSSPSVASSAPSSSSSTSAAPTTPSDPHTGTVAPAPPAGNTISLPVRVSVASVGISSGLQRLGLLSDGTLQSPSQWQVAGWYAKGVVPGDPGPAVIAGHVDSVNGPAVFFRLKEIKEGDAIVITQADGGHQKWVVDDVQEYPKNKFPTDAVYGPTPEPVLRLVTCTGDFDYSKRSYVDNLVVSAHLA